MEGPTHPPFGQYLSLETRDVELDERRYEKCCRAPSGPAYVLFCMHCTVEGSVNLGMNLKIHVSNTFLCFNAFGNVGGG